MNNGNCVQVYSPIRVRGYVTSIERIDSAQWIRRRLRRRRLLLKEIIPRAGQRFSLLFSATNNRHDDESGWFIKLIISVLGAHVEGGLTYAQVDDRILISVEPDKLVEVLKAAR